jgi:hypothetical protein
LFSGERGGTFEFKLTVFGGRGRGIVVIWDLYSYPLIHTLHFLHQSVRALSIIGCPKEGFLQTRNATYPEDKGPSGRIDIYRNITEKYIIELVNIFAIT